MPPEHGKGDEAGLSSSGWGLLLLKHRLKVCSEPGSSEAVPGQRAEQAPVYRWGQWLVQESWAWKEKDGDIQSLPERSTKLSPGQCYSSELRLHLASLWVSSCCTENTKTEEMSNTTQVANPACEKLHETMTTFLQ